MVTYFKMQSENLKVGAPVYFVVNNPEYPYQKTEWQNKICGGAGCDDDSLSALAYDAYRRSEQLVFININRLILILDNQCLSLCTGIRQSKHQHI